MNPYTQSRVDEIRKTGQYNLSFDAVFTEIFKLYSQSWWQFAVMYLVVVMVACSLVFTVVLTTNALNFNLENIDVDTIDNYSGKLGLVQVFGSTIVAVLLAPFNVGFFKVLQDLKYEGEFRFSNFFYYYKDRAMLSLMLVALIVTLFTNTVNFAFESLKLNSPFLNFIPILLSIVVFFYTFFVNPLIVFGRFSVNKAFETSFQLVPMRFMAIFSIVFCAFVLCMSGMLLFCIGILFTMSFLFLSYYVIYDQVIGTDPKLLRDNATDEDQWQVETVEQQEPASEEKAYEVYTKTTSQQPEDKPVAENENQAENSTLPAAEENSADLDHPTENWDKNKPENQ